MSASDRLKAFETSEPPSEASRTGFRVLRDVADEGAEPWFPITVRAELLVRGTRSYPTVTSVSRRGIFVRDDAPPPLGELIRLGISLPAEREKLIVSARVVQVRPPDASFNRDSGFCARFVGLADDAEEMWDEFVSVLGEMPRRGDSVVAPTSSVTPPPSQVTARLPDAGYTTVREMAAIRDCDITLTIPLYELEALRARSR